MILWGKALRAHCLLAFNLILIKAQEGICCSRKRGREPRVVQPSWGSEKGKGGPCGWITGSPISVLLRPLILLVQVNCLLVKLFVLRSLLFSSRHVSPSRSFRPIHCNVTDLLYIQTLCCSDQPQADCPRSLPGDTTTVGGSLRRSVSGRGRQLKIKMHSHG